MQGPVADAAFELMRPFFFFLLLFRDKVAEWKVVALRRKIVICNRTILASNKKMSLAKNGLVRLQIGKLWCFIGKDAFFPPPNLSGQSRRVLGERCFGLENHIISFCTMKTITSRQSRLCAWGRHGMKY